MPLSKSKSINHGHGGSFSADADEQGVGVGVEISISPRHAEEEGQDEDVLSISMDDADADDEPTDTHHFMMTPSPSNETETGNGKRRHAVKALKVVLATTAAVGTIWGVRKVSKESTGNTAGAAVLQLQAFEESEDFPGYARIPGFGECTDISGNLYPYVRYDLGVLALPNPKEKCAELCAICPGPPESGSGLTLRGFEFSLVTSRCYCLVDYGPTFNKALCGSDDSEYNYGVGSGEIFEADGNDRYLCWKFVGFGSSKSSKTSGQSSKTSKSSSSPLSG